MGGLGQCQDKVTQMSSEVDIRLRTPLPAIKRTIMRRRAGVVERGGLENR